MDIVEITDEELEQMQLEAFLEEAKKLWDKKFWEDIECGGMNL